MSGRSFYLILLSRTTKGLGDILQISPTSCTILLNIFISLLPMFRASMCSSSGENYCIYATLVFVTLYGCCLVCWLDWIQPADQTPPIQSDKHHCRIDTVIFSYWWAHGCPKHVEKRNKFTGWFKYDRVLCGLFTQKSFPVIFEPPCIKQNCAPVWTICEIIQGCTVNRTSILPTVHVLWEI